MGLFIHSAATHTVHGVWRQADGSWTAWADLKSPVAGAPVAARAKDGRVAVFFRNPDGRLVVHKQTADGSGWDIEVIGADLLGDPVVGFNGDGRMEVFIVGSDGALWHLWTNGDGPEGWAVGRFGGSNVKAIVWALTTGGRQGFFHVNSSGEVWLIQQTAANGYWSDFSNPVNGVTADISAAGLPADRLGVAFTDGSGRAWLQAEPPGGGAWTAPQTLSRPDTTAAGRPTVVRRSDGSLVAVWRQQAPQIGPVAAIQSAVDGPWVTYALGDARIASAPSAVLSPTGGLHLGLRFEDQTVGYTQLLARAYVCSQGDNKLSVIDTPSGSVVATLAFTAIGSLAGIAVHPDGSRFYVAKGSALLVVDTATHAVVATVPLGQGEATIGVAVNPAGTRVYVCTNSSVKVVDTSTNTVATTITVGGFNRSVAFSPDGSKAYVTNDNAGTVSVVDTSTNKVAVTAAVGKAPFGVAVKPDGTRAYVCNRDSNSVSVLDTSTNKVVATIDTTTSNARPHDVVVTPDGTKAYVSCDAAGRLAVIDTATNKLTATITVVAGPVGLAMDKTGSRIYVAGSKGSTVSIVDIATDKVVATTTVGLSPTYAAVRPMAAG
ncbi:MAG: beta-propeller fold lactonase family protein [Actinophytocola sp.]|uniref:beta-propeller fold lactonase family protein n=1 Tax=Actinophytocola sp. TaxID=1872138 RepID=UPI003C74386D